MKRTSLVFTFLLVVIVGMVIACDIYAANVAKISIIELSALKFQTAMGGGGAYSETVLPEDSGAAVFNITGEPLQMVTISILGTLEIVNTKDRIPIESFYYGGALDSSGIGTIDVGGNLNGVKIGAKINIPADPTPGTYEGRFKLRAVYQ